MRGFAHIACALAFGCTSQPTAAIIDATIQDSGVALDATAPSVDASTPADAGQPQSSCGEERVRDYISIPMRDGQMLLGSVDRPVMASCRLPTIVIQTPYNIENVHDAFFGSGRVSMPLFSSPHYNFVAVDWRGSFGSRDAAIRPPQPYAQDGYDTIEWIAEQSWSDGKVGTWGVSALCVQQYRTASQQPPHLLAAVPIFCSMNIDYPQVYPGGVIRREYVETLQTLGFAGIRAFEDHPTFDSFWSLLGGAIRPDSIRTPMLVVAGWWDLDPRGVVRSFSTLQRDSDPAARDQHRLMIGNWHHFAAGGEGGALRALSDEERQYTDASRRIQRDSLAFFDHHLRAVDSEAANWAPVRYHQVGDDWTGSQMWPPRILQTTRRLYLGQDNLLTEVSPTPGEMSFLYEPRDASPTRGGGTLSPTQIHGPTSQVDVLARGDRLTFVTPELQEPLAITGRLSVDLEVSTTGQDTDFAVRVTDVDPSGDHLLIGEGIQRLKLREGFTTPAAVMPDERYTLTVSLTGDLGYTIPVGHRLGLIVSSANFPRFDRNSNDGADFFEQSPAPANATNTLYLGANSSLVIPLAE